MVEQPADTSDEALIAYVRGRLPTEEARRVAEEAARRPGLAAEIALMRGIAAAVDADADAPAPGELGWARLSRALEKEPRPATRRPPLWQLAAASAAAVVVWQLLAVPLLMSPDPGARYAPVTQQPASDLSLSVAFVPTASEEAIRALLREIDAQITAGPSAVGLWRLGFQSDAARDAGLARLEASGIVESAQAE
jgi:anti-sigma factor RsiW